MGVIRPADGPQDGSEPTSTVGGARDAAETRTEPKTDDWHYAGFGITHTGPREDCQPCTLARQMAVDAWNDPYWWGTPGWTAMEGGR